MFGDIDKIFLHRTGRVNELKNAGLIRDSGKTKQGKWGLQITIWELT